MKIRSNNNPSSRFYYRFRIGSWHIYLSRHRMKLRQDDHGSTRTLQALRNDRLRHAEYKCEACGRDIHLYSNLYRIHPAGHPERNRIENVRVLCIDCRNRANADEQFRADIVKGCAL